MPPKKQNTKELILQKAFEIVRADGYEGLSARKLAKELQCSTQPIYQAFPDMTSLKIALIEKAQKIMTEIISRNQVDGFPPIVSTILGYIQFAEEEKKLYRLIYAPELSSEENLKSFYPKLDAAELDLLIYAHGIVMMRSFGTLNLPCETIQTMVLRAYELFSMKK